MLDESDYSFEYEDDDDVSLYAENSLVDDRDDEYSNSRRDADTTMDTGETDAFKKSPQTPASAHAPHAELDPQATRTYKLPNQLSAVVYRPFSISLYINEHMLVPGRRLQQTYLPQFSVDEAVSLLHHKKWLVNEVTSDYFDNWPRLRDAAGLTDARGASRPHIHKSGDFMCMICCEAGDLDVFSLLCGHEYCAPCYKQYVQLCLSRGALVRCIDTLCGLSLLYADVSELLLVELSPEEAGSGGHVHLDDGYDLEILDVSQHDLLEDIGSWAGAGTSRGSEECDPLVANPLLVNAARVLIDAMHSKYRWCPSVDCTLLVECVSGQTDEPGLNGLSQNGKDAGTSVQNSNDLARVAVVTCTSNHQFCFNCHYENHLPCPCWLAKAWVKRCEDDSETANWIDANTQGCPKCQAVIEKNGGCNHMLCSTCAYQFCWICLGDWAAHNSSYWQCSRFNPKEPEESKKRRTDKQNSLSKYLHFYRRFTVHQVSMKGDKQTLRKVHRCMHQYMKAQGDRTGSWNDVEFLTDAIRSLSSGRKTLMWTYAFAFYLNPSNYLEIFESMQDYLNETVESLSRLFEQIQILDSPARTAAKISAKKAEIKELASRVKKRRDLLIESAHTGLAENMLLFRNPT